MWWALDKKIIIFGQKIIESRQKRGNFEQKNVKEKNIVFFDKKNVDLKHVLKTCFKTCFKTTDLKCDNPESKCPREWKFKKSESAHFIFSQQSLGISEKQQIKLGRPYSKSDVWSHAIFMPFSWLITHIISILCLILHNNNILITKKHFYWSQYQLVCLKDYAPESFLSSLSSLLWFSAVRLQSQPPMDPFLDHYIRWHKTPSHPSTWDCHSPLDVAQDFRIICQTVDRKK